MDLPLNEKELDAVILTLWQHRKTDKVCGELYERLKLTKSLMDEGLPYKKILREEHGMSI